MKFKILATVVLLALLFSAQQIVIGTATALAQYERIKNSRISLIWEYDRGDISTLDSAKQEVASAPPGESY